MAPDILPEDASTLDRSRPQVPKRCSVVGKTRFDIGELRLRTYKDKEHENKKAKSFDCHGQNASHGDVCDNVSCLSKSYLRCVVLLQCEGLKKED
jgi:hypothetical protein